MKLDQDEQTLLDSVETGEWQSVPEFEARAPEYQEYAKATMRKDKRINIRISERDLLRLQQRALQEGIPYQTLISSVLHKYVSGRLVEKTP